MKRVVFILAAILSFGVQAQEASKAQKLLNEVSAKEPKVIPEDEEINISNYVEEDSNSITPSKMFTFYQNGYNYKMDITQNVKGREIQYVKLTPMDSKAEIKNILLGIDTQTKHIYNMIQTQENGTKVTITVKSFKTDQPLAKNLFTFNEARYSDFYINRLD